MKTAERQSAPVPALHSARDPALDVYRGLAVLSMLINHSHLTFLPSVAAAITSYLTVTMFAWCLGAGAALSWRNARLAAGHEASFASLYSRFLARSLLRAAILLLAHCLLMWAGRSVSVVLAYLAVGLVGAAVLVPLGNGLRLAAAAAATAAEPLVHAAWERHVHSLGPSVTFDYLGGYAPHFIPGRGEWGNFLFGASELSAGMTQYSGLGVLAVALVGMAVVEGGVCDGLIRRLRGAGGALRQGGIGLSAVVVFYAAAKVLARLGAQTEPYAKNPQERILEIGMLVGLWIVTTAAVSAWRTGFPRRVLGWLSTVGASTLSLYVLHAVMLSRLQRTQGFLLSKAYTSGLFGIGFVLLWMALPVIWHLLVTQLGRKALSAGQGSAATPEADGSSPRSGRRALSGTAGQKMRLIRALSRGPLEVVEEAVTGLVPRLPGGGGR